MAAQSASPTAMQLLAVGLLLVGFAFKVSAVPFHMWTPDAYEGAPPAVTGFMSTGVKAAAFAAFARVFLAAFEPLHDQWWTIVWVMAAATMIVGCPEHKNRAQVVQGKPALELKKAISFPLMSTGLPQNRESLVDAMSTGQLDVHHRAPGAHTVRHPERVQAARDGRGKRSDRRDRRRVRRPERRSGPRRVPRRVRAAAVHHRERLLPQGRPERWEDLPGG